MFFHMVKQPAGYCLLNVVEAEEMPRFVIFSAFNISLSLRKEVIYDVNCRRPHVCETFR